MLQRKNIVGKKNNEPKQEPKVEDENRKGKWTY